ncbi:glycoside hydrolase family 43 protein [Paenibacillus oryzae]|uniref:glycoside hydrolase family 43 protein n=1 Tax=Paenibacillus oryzae TaxID=1844972 RepID=UPI000A44A681|nr:glycoside hydrolase family 43 protein [Paenibacillus oryzae]
MLNRKKGLLLVAAAALTLSVVAFILIRASMAPGGGETSVLPPAAYLEVAGELEKQAGSALQLRLLADPLPAGWKAASLEAFVQLPDMLEADEVVPNPDNLAADEVSFSPADGGIRIVMRNGDGSAVSFTNEASGNELLTLILKSNRGLRSKMSEEIKVNKLEATIEGKENKAYDVSGATASVDYNPPAAAVGKLPPNGNPVVAHKFGADPYTLVFDGRVYLYNTYDVFEYDAAGNVKDNSYSSINRLSVISSDDLVNWTDHGYINVAGREGAAKWATQSWAPAAAHKVIDGKDQFFLYFANNASHIGVLVGDSPVGPFRDPIGKPLISREATPGVKDVTWLFDPAVLMDDDGKAYIYFGGGLPEGQAAMPNTARVMELGEDMISVVGEAQVIPAPFMFEDSGINKVNGLYYYTYCTNFIQEARTEDSPPPGEIAYMVSESPMGPWTYKGTILKNPGHFFGVGGNNHHAIFSFNDSYYIAYHAQTLSKAMGHPQGYRSTHLNEVVFEENGDIREIEANFAGVAQVGTFDPYALNDAATVGWSAGIATELVEAASESKGPSVVVTDIHNGDWLALSNVDFGQGAASFAITAAVEEGGIIELRLDSPEGEKIGQLAVSSSENGAGWQELSTEVKGAAGVHHLYLVFKGKEEASLFKLESWQFSRS